jgi:uncharacterized protein YdcH (DUF465 family)
VINFVKAEHLYNPRFYEIFTKYETAAGNIEEKDKELPCGAVVEIENFKRNELKIIEKNI